MSDLYLEALQNYLNGPEWRSSIDDFIRTYCQYFVQINNNPNQLPTGKLITTFDFYRVHDHQHYDCRNRHHHHQYHHHHHHAMLFIYLGDGKGSKETYESSHEQYTMFTSYQAIVEEILDNALANIGGKDEIMMMMIMMMIVMVMVVMMMMMIMMIVRVIMLMVMTWAVVFSPFNIYHLFISPIYIYMNRQYRFVGASHR